MLLGKANQGLTSLNLSNDCWKIRESVEAKVRTFGSIDDVLLEEEAAEDEEDNICFVSASKPCQARRRFASPFASRSSLRT